MIDQPIEPFVHTLRIDASNWKPSRTSVDLTLAQLQRLADDFDLGRIIKMDVPLTTQCNTTDPFQTGQGTFMLRARHGEEFVERVEYLHYLIDHLRYAKFPTATVIRSKSGKSWTLWGERIVEVHGFVPHDPGIHRDWRRMNAAASALADLHRLLTEAATRSTPVPPEMRNDVTPRQCWMMLEETMAVLQHDFQGDYRLERAMELLQKAKALLEPLMPDYERTVGRLPWMMVHGDFHFWNILYRADHIAAVVDYDFVQERERIFDLAYAMQSIVAHMKAIHGRQLQHPGDLQWSNVRMWVDLYDDAAEVQLTDREREWLPKELLRIFLVSVATAAMQDDPMGSLMAIEDDLPIYAWIGEQDDLFR